MAEKPVKPKRPARTLKEKKFVKEYIANGGNATQAALAAYDTKQYKSASRIGNENTSKLSFDHYFEKAGLTDEVIAQSIAAKALTAKKRDQFSGEVTDDHTEQRHNLELAIKIMGKFAPPRAAVDETGKTVVPILTTLEVHSDPDDVQGDPGDL